MSSPLNPNPDKDASNNEILALPESGTTTSSVPSLQIGGDSLSLDDLGPIIVNRDGSTSRVTNWLEMGKEEQERTQRMIVKRNEKRLKELKEKIVNGEL